MTKFFQPSKQVAVSAPYRIAAERPAAEAPLSAEQALALASWDQSPPAQRTAPAMPAAKRRFQGWRVP